MNAKTHEFYDCVETENQLFVNCYSDKVYFETMNYEDEEDGGMLLDREKVELLISQLNKWLDDTI